MRFFGICPEDGCIQWMELQEDLMSEIYGNSTYNSLNPDGTINHLNEYIRLKDKEYQDIICARCECPVIIIPFDICDIDQRKLVYKMSNEERIKFAQRFEVLDSLE